MIDREKEGRIDGLFKYRKTNIEDGTIIIYKFTLTNTKLYA